jgi:uncharacterized repeat protein (TIGR03837 family)
VTTKNASQPAWNNQGQLQISYLPALTQRDFDHMLWACDLNFVRGEDSLVRALWAGKPLVWQIYAQTGDAHHRKLAAFLDLLQATPSLRAVHQIWNGVVRGTLPELDLARWRQTVSEAQNRLLAQDDLVTKLIQFSEKSR